MSRSPGHTNHLTAALRGLAAVFLAFYVNYLPWHLAQACHLPAPVKVAAVVPDLDCDHEDSCCPPHVTEGNAHHHHHVPHPADEHLLEFVNKVPDALVGLDLAVLTGAAIPQLNSTSFHTLPVVSEWPPDAPPVYSFRPRGPPVV